MISIDLRDGRVNILRTTCLTASYNLKFRFLEACLAQWLTHFTCNEKIPGSTPGVSFLSPPVD